MRTHTPQTRSQRAMRRIAASRTRSDALTLTRTHSHMHTSMQIHCRYTAPFTAHDHHQVWAHARTHALSHIRMLTCMQIHPAWSPLRFEIRWVVLSPSSLGSRAHAFTLTRMHAHMHADTPRWEPIMIRDKVGGTIIIKFEHMRARTHSHTYEFGCPELGCPPSVYLLFIV